MRDDLLAQLQQTDLIILDELVRICRKHSIQYCLLSGTLLGAVKYGGFIPWDDDIDVGMLRSEYERFCRIAAAEVSERFFLHCREVDPNYPLNFAKLRLNGTELVQWYDEKTMHVGVNIDIFPLDFAPEGEPAFSLFCWKHKCIQALLFAKLVARYKKRSLKSLLVWVASWLFPRDFLCRAQKKSLSGRKQTGRVVNLFNSWGPRKECFPVQWFETTKLLPFEGRILPVPGDPVGYVTKVYGDYKKDPPPEKQVSHHEYVRLNLGEYGRGQESGKLAEE